MAAALAILLLNQQNQRQRQEEERARSRHYNASTTFQVSADSASDSDIEPSWPQDGRRKKRSELNWDGMLNLNSYNDQLKSRLPGPKGVSAARTASTDQQTPVSASRDPWAIIAVRHKSKKLSQASCGPPRDTDTNSSSRRTSQSSSIPDTVVRVQNIRRSNSK